MNNLILLWPKLFGGRVLCTSYVDQGSGCGYCHGDWRVGNGVGAGVSREEGYGSGNVYGSGNGCGPLGWSDGDGIGVGYDDDQSF